MANVESPHPHRPEPFNRLRPGHLLCNLRDLADPGAKSFVFEGKAELLSIFVVRKGPLVRAYVNRCPHAGACLNSGPNDFFTRDAAYIMCGRHGALFTLDEGKCVAGPCLNYGLQPVPIEIKANNVYTASADSFYTLPE